MGHGGSPILGPRRVCWLRQLCIPVGLLGEKGNRGGLRLACRRGQRPWRTSAQSASYRVPRCGPCCRSQLARMQSSLSISACYATSCGGRPAACLRGACCAACRSRDGAVFCGVPCKGFPRLLLGSAGRMAAWPHGGMALRAVHSLVVARGMGLGAGGCAMGRPLLGRLALVAATTLAARRLIIGEVLWRLKRAVMQKSVSDRARVRRMHASQYGGLHGAGTRADARRSCRRARASCTAPRALCWSPNPRSPTARVRMRTSAPG